MAQKKIQEKLEAKQGNMINMKRRLPKVNPQMALRLLAEKSGGLHKDNGEALEAAMLANSEQQSGGVNPANFIDERFAGLFEDEDFAIDETSDTFKLANPSGITRQETELRRKVGVDGVSRGNDGNNMRNNRNVDSLESFQGFELVGDVDDNDENTHDSEQIDRRQRGLSDDDGEDEDILDSRKFRGNEDEWNDLRDRLEEDGDRGGGDGGDGNRGDSYDGLQFGRHSKR